MAATYEKCCNIRNAFLPLIALSLFCNECIKKLYRELNDPATTLIEATFKMGNNTPGFI